MSVKILSVSEGSPASKAGIKPGEVLYSINNCEIMDVLDYRFYEVNSDINVSIINSCGVKREINIKKEEYEEIGLEFETYLMDNERRCKNKCIFCFIDQLPKGMRESLYFKDDDSRLSFLFGNYITLTNLSDREVERIISMHISPVNVSVHTTNPKLRVKMMKNKFAGDALLILDKFVNAGIRINCQIVLCPGVNDGEELIKTLNDLEKFVPFLESIAVVPVGLTKYRKGLFELKPYNKISSKQVIDIINEFGEKCLAKYGTRIAYPSDEFYLKAEVDIPAGDFFEGFPQIENGVGMIASLRDEFENALNDTDPFKISRKITIATGVAVYETINNLILKAEEKFKGLKVKIKPIINNFFGELINVTGLITGKDLISQLKGEDIGEELLISSSMLRSEGDLFLDNISLDDVRNELGVEVITVENDGYKLLDALLGGEC